MSISSRIHDTLEQWQAEWKDRLRGWMASWFSQGFESFTTSLEPDVIDAMRGTLTELLEDPDLPPGLQTAIRKALGKGNIIDVVGGYLILMISAIPAVLGGAQPLGNLISYKHEKMLHSYRADPSFISRIWLRDKEAWEWLWDDLRDQGFDEKRLEAVKELVNIIPPLADMVRFADFGSFDPKIIEKWREFYDAPGWIREPMSLIGITGEWADKYWFSHWRQPGRFELGELHRRGLIDDETVKTAYLTQGFSAFWQNLLLELVKEPWTRVDVRRMWDMRTIDEAQLRKAYQAVGYYDEQLEGMILWTKVYVAFPDLMARWTKGWITIDDVRAELTGLGMPAERVEEMIQTKIKAAEPERVEEGRALTKTEIYKGVKKDLITWEEGVELLMDLGYDEDEADYILAVNVGVLEGSPETFAEFKEWTTKYRIATGREVKAMPEELKKAADEVVKLTKEVEALSRSIEEEEGKLIDVEVLPEETTARLTELQVARNRAIAELERVKSEYDARLAEWKYGRR